MPQRTAAKKSLRQSRRRQLRNKTIKSRLRTEQNKFDRMLERGDVQGAQSQLDLLTRLYHRAAARNIVHGNLASRKQAQFQARLNRTKARTATTY